MQQKAFSLHTKGVTNQNIAKELGVTVEAVMDMINNEINDRIVAAYQNGSGEEEIARAMNVHIISVRRALRDIERPRKRSEASREEMERKRMIRYRIEEHQEKLRAGL